MHVGLFLLDALIHLDEPHYINCPFSWCSLSVAVEQKLSIKKLFVCVQLWCTESDQS